MAPFSRCASARARADLPLAVGPAMISASTDLVEDVTDKSVGQLGFEPGGLRRHDLACVRHRHQLLQAGGMQRERGFGAAAVDPAREFAKAADAADEVDA